MGCDIDELIGRYFASEALPEEIEQIDRWLTEDESHFRYFSRCRNLYDVFPPAFPPEEIDTEKTLRKIMPLASWRRKVLVRWTVAAAVVLLIVTVIGVYFLRKDARDEVVRTIAGLSEERQAGIILTLASGEKIGLDGEAPRKISGEDGTQIRVTGDTIEYKAEQESGEKMKYHVLNVPRGKEFFMTLNDGSRVWGNAETEIRYPVKFATRERKIFVFLGEVYLEVAHRAEAPFIVVTPQSKVTVLGTSFNVKAYPEEAENQITLISGKVRVTSKATGESVMLIPGEQPGLTKNSGEMVKRQVDTDLYCLWSQGKLVFRNNSLEEILYILARRYDMHVIWEKESLKNSRFPVK